MSDDRTDAIRVFLVDDHAVVRRGIRSYLEVLPDMQVVGEAADGHEALAQLGELTAVGHAPHIVMMDLVMPQMDGIAATELIKERWPAIDVVAMTSFTEADKVHGALQAGATGYLLKDAEADELASAIRAARRGEVHLDAVVAKRLTRALVAEAADVQALSPREREVISLVAQGLSNRDIADRLYISERTARSHVSSILTKLGLASRTQAALWAIRQGITPPPP